MIRFAWRLALLFLTGLLHHIHYRGDIFTIYALLGFGLLLFYRASDKVLLVLGVLFTLNVPSFLIRLGEGIAGNAAVMFPEQDQAHLATYYNAVSSGSYFEIIRLNLLDFGTKMSFQWTSGRAFITFGLFLLGYYAGRKAFFQNVASHGKLLKTALRYSWQSILAVVAFTALFFGSAHILKLQLPTFVQMAVGGLCYDLFNTAMFVLYLTGVILLFQKETWRNRLMVFYETGRMGMTTYIMQTVFGFLIFFNPGLGLINKLGAAACFALGLLLYAAQIVFSKWWFRHFHYGFFEWLWRSATYLRGQKLLKEKAAVAVSS